MTPRAVGLAAGAVAAGANFAGPQLHGEVAVIVGAIGAAAAFLVSALYWQAHGGGGGASSPPPPGDRASTLPSLAPTPPPWTRGKH